MYVYIYVYIYIYMYICIYIYIYILIGMHASMHPRTHVCIHACMSLKFRSHELPTPLFLYFLPMGRLDASASRLGLTIST